MPGSTLQQDLDLLGAKQDWVNHARNALNGNTEAFLNPTIAQALESDRYEVANPTDPLDGHLKVAKGVGEALNEVIETIVNPRTVATSDALHRLMNTFEATKMVSVRLSDPLRMSLPQPSVADPRLQAAILSTATTSRPAGPFTSLLLETLGTPAAGKRLEAAVMMPVLLHNERANRGEIGSLHIALRTSGPIGLHPDPSMAFSHLDQAFLNGLQTSYALSKQADTINCITWSVKDAHGAPVREFKGESVTAAIAIALNELPARRGLPTRALWRLRPRQLDTNCAITAGVTTDGRLTKVGHYGTKMAAVAAQEKPALRLIVAAKDAERPSQLPGEVRSIAEQHSLLQRVAPAVDLTEATSATRNKLNGHFVAAIAILAVLVAAVTPVYVVLSSQARAAQQQAAEQRQRDLVSSAADKAAAQARALIDNGDQPTGLLVAMASDALLRQLGRDGNVLGDLLTESVALTKVVAPPQGGRFSELALSADGQTLIVAGNNGHVRIMDTQDGITDWKRTYPPGLQLAPGQVWVTHVAMAADGRHAAYRTSDDLIHLIYRDGSGEWAQAGTAESETADSLVFSPNGTAIVTSVFGKGGRTTRYRVLSDRITLDYSCPSPGVQAAAALDKAVLFATNSTVFSIPDRRCRSRVVFALPRSSAVQALETNQTGRLSVAVSTPRGLHLLSPSRPARTVTTEPVESASLLSTAERTIVTYTSQAGTFGWSDESGRRYFEFAEPDKVASDGDQVVAYIHDGTIELYRLGGGNLAVIREIPTPNPPMALAYVSKDGLAAGTLNGVNLISTAHPRLSAEESSVLPGSEGLTTVLATRPEIDYIVAIESDPGGGGHLTARSWAIDTRTEIPVPIDEGGKVPLSATLLPDGRLALGHADGVVRLLRVGDDEWQEVSRTQLPGAVSSLSSDDQGNVYALSRSAPDRPIRALLTQFELRTTDVAFHQVASTTLTGQALAGEIAVLEDGGVIVALGAGDTSFHEPDTLAPQGDPIAGRLGVVWDIVELPSLNQTVVVGRNPNLTIRTSTHTPLFDTQWTGNRTFLAVASNNKGTQIASAGSAGILIWEEDPLALQARTCEAVGRTLTTAQWREYVSTEIPYDNPCP